MGSLAPVFETCVVLVRCRAVVMTLSDFSENYNFVLERFHMPPGGGSTKQPNEKI